MNYGNKWEEVVIIGSEVFNQIPLVRLIHLDNDFRIYLIEFEAYPEGAPIE